LGQLAAEVSKDRAPINLRLFDLDATNQHKKSECYDEKAKNPKSIGLPANKLCGFSPYALVNLCWPEFGWQSILVNLDRWLVCKK
jgi:hypothetical protein